MLNKGIVGVALTCVAILAVASQASADAKRAGTGKIEITVTDPVKQPISGWDICPTTQRNGTIRAGRCEVTNKEGRATLRQVKPGVVYVAQFFKGKPELPDFKKITVRPGRTTDVRWENAGS